MTEYTAYYNNKQVKKVVCDNREQAVKKVKRWYYDRIRKGKGQFKGKARLVLSVSDPQTEIRYAPSFDTMVDKNNYLLKKDLKRIISESNGHLKLIDKKELDKRVKKVGQIKQLEWIKRDRTDDIARQVNIVPHIFTNNKGTLFYRVTTSTQKTIGTKWSKGSRKGSKPMPRWDGDGRRVWTSESLKEKPACLERGKKVTEHRSKLIALKAKSLKGAVEEIKERKLHKQDVIKKSKHRVTEIETALNAVFKLNKIIKWFSFRGSKSVKYIFCPNCISIKYYPNKNTLEYNPSWVHASDEEAIIKKFRSFLR